MGCLVEFVWVCGYSYGVEFIGGVLSGSVYINPGVRHVLLVPRCFLNPGTLSI